MARVKVTSSDINARLAKGECANYVGGGCQGRTPCLIVNGEPCQYFDDYVKPLLEQSDLSARYTREAKVKLALNPNAKVVRQRRQAEAPALALETKSAPAPKGARRQAATPRVASAPKAPVAKSPRRAAAPKTAPLLDAPRAAASAPPRAPKAVLPVPTTAPPAPKAAPAPRVVVPSPSVVPPPKASPAPTPVQEELVLELTPPAPTRPRGRR